MARDYDVYARLTVDGTEVPISSFDFEQPEGEIGARLTAEVADIDVDLDAEDGGVVTFELGIDAGAGIEWVPLMDVGRLDTSSTETRWPGDSLKITAISRLGDKFDLAPAIPITLYDPGAGSIIATSSGTMDDVVDEDRQPIEPELVPVDGLDLAYLLDFVYVQKLGFSEVVTNIESYSIPRADFKLSDTFHGVALRELSLFEPEFHSDDGTTLYITYPLGTLPEGLDVHALRLNGYATFTLSKQRSRVVNAVVLSFRQNASASAVITTAVETEINEAGTPFTNGWQRTTETRHVRKFHDNPLNLDEVSASHVFQKDISVMAWDGLNREVYRESQVDSYAFDFRLKDGYTKTVSIRTKLPGLPALMRQVQVETNQIVWDAVAGSPGEYIKKYEVTSVIGTVLNSDDVRTALFHANRLQDIPDDAEVEESRPITTEIKRYRIVGRDQVEISPQRINYLTTTPVPEMVRTDTHTGTIQARTGAQAFDVNMILVLPGTLDSDRRPPMQIKAGNVPLAMAKEIALKTLARQGAKPESGAFTAAGLDMALRRGSVRNVHDRLDNGHRIVVTSVHITGSELGTPSFKVTMSGTGKKVEE